MRIGCERASDERLGELAPEVQWERFEGTKLTCNAEMTVAEVREFCRIDSASQALLKAAMNQTHFSARA